MCRLSDERYEYIKKEVVHLFDCYGINCIPINGFELAYKLGIRLVPYYTTGTMRLLDALLWKVLLKPSVKVGLLVRLKFGSVTRRRLF